MCVCVGQTWHPLPAVWVLEPLNRDGESLTLKMGTGIGSNQRAAARRLPCNKSHTLFFQGKLHLLGQAP